MKLLLALLTAVSLTGTLSAQTSLNDKRDVVKNWIETRQTLARVRADWAAEKDTLTAAVAAFERELKTLNDSIGKADTGSVKTEDERKQVEADRAKLDAAIAQAKGVVTKLEAKLMQLSKALPEPVLAKVQPFFNRIPKDPADTKATLPERTQNLVGILNEVDKFNAAITVESEIRKNPAGADVQVRTLYLGLGQAYFTDTEGNYAGSGIPTAEGWQWTVQNDLSPAIRKAIAVYENTAPVQFVELPVQIK
jgi:septal ring factor EnvC (AmiA/AmiB activator)